jgi:Tfp pilus assembly protein PilP
MKMLFVYLLILFLPGFSGSTEMRDPFVNPLEKTLSRKENVVITKREEVVNLYNPVINKSLNELKIEGVIGVDGKNFLVAKDPETEKVYMLKEGDAISPDTRIERVSHDKVILVKYYREGKELKKSFIKLKVDEEE